ncbi:MAG: hypothetical protein A2087_11560 [Spirochaetes bacterium GWD1_61_31]|nr:MAG: hypothetical protein A2Y37_14790 [Spirochaetes bacterium GWB1_60_80]OHD29330.1 MAG: hypothetical protein A2004_08290 [Spirochaetes bacterium GWC1_61_12]OHD35837.1 MAG: hypothetical protein A2087_11560 [Spirochaetes bacterium GWD1_61_31]OHD46779.1 MAG: hypothetical protein A2Y35_10730 [Spirochaetes bacterium GWE1_60_18]OHD61231.1 MAG: hypothetical protein A2Y32_13025 [Spirochaetes bacterium GWF1_60_12]HAP43011.1 hypothetical protein [Spirochaetaceae bacterium]
MVSIDNPLEPGSDGYLEISISLDKLSAYGYFHPPAEGIKPLTLSSVEKRLAELKITYDIDWKVIQDAIFVCNTVFGVVVEVELARVIEPARGLNPSVASTM